MQQYQELVQRILHHGHRKDDRTGTGTLSVFGHQMRFNLQDGFPLVKGKHTFWYGAFVEMLWFLRGDTNIQWLHKHGVHIWDEWANAEGDLGPIYGAQWRDAEGEFDQIAALIHGLRTDPSSRRHIVDAWNPEVLPLPGVAPCDQAALQRMALAPCHALVQFDVTDGRLSCQVYQRSADVFLGVPFNVAGYALLTHLLAYHCGYQPGELVWTGGDCHLYLNHFQQAVQMLERQPRDLPSLLLLHEPERPLWQIEPDELVIDDHGRRKSMTYYEAKFAREAKENPLDWVILPAGSGKVQLVRVRESS